MFRSGDDLVLESLAQVTEVIAVTSHPDDQVPILLRILLCSAQCSGIQSLISLLSVTALFTYAVRGPGWGRLALLAAAIPLAMLSNILRVSSLIGVARYLGTDAAFSFYHDYSGPLFFLAALLLMVPLARLFQCKTLRFEVL